MKKICKICKICGYIDISTIEKCPQCQANQWEDYDLYQIKQISTDESFINTMIKLHDEDPVDFQLKFNQFMLQKEQQKQIKQAEENRNIPHCPTCGSTDIKKISAATKVTNTIAFGIFGTKRHKTYHCNNCKYEW